MLYTLLALGLFACDQATISASPTATQSAGKTADTSEDSQPSDSAQDSATDSSGMPTDPAALARYKAATKIISKYCISCHNGFDTLTEGEYQRSYYTLPGAPYDSSIYTELRGSDGPGNHTMPRGGSALSTKEIATIKDWITQMQSAQP